MSNQEEWDDMTQQRQDEIKARVIAACDTDANAAPTYRQRLTHYSRSGLAARLAKG